MSRAELEASAASLAHELTAVSTRNEAGMPVPGLLVIAERNKPTTRARKADDP